VRDAKPGADHNLGISKKMKALVETFDGRKTPVRNPSTPSRPGPSKNTKVADLKRLASVLKSSTRRVEDFDTEAPPLRPSAARSVAIDVDLRSAVAGRRSPVGGRRFRAGQSLWSAAEQRGARRVLRLDNLNYRRGGLDGFSFLKAHFGSRVEWQGGCVFDLPREDFDIVLCHGVLYHLNDPFTAATNCFQIAAERVVFEGLSSTPRPR
jgi:hypothetical protein